MEMLKRLFVEEEGQGMTEYGIVLGVIAIAVVGILVALRDQIVTLFTNARDVVTNAATESTPTP